MQHLQAMSTPVGFRKFMSLMHRFGDDDAKLAAILGISRSMVWRLKHAKIQKIEPYIQALERHFGEAQAQAQSLDGVLEDLKLWSNNSPELRRMLISLHKIVQDFA